MRLVDPYHEVIRFDEADRTNPYGADDLPAVDRDRQVPPALGERDDHLMLLGHADLERHLHQRTLAGAPIDVCPGDRGGVLHESDLVTSTRRILRPATRQLR